MVTRLTKMPVAAMGRVRPKSEYDSCIERGKDQIRPGDSEMHKVNLGLPKCDRSRVRTGPLASRVKDNDDERDNESA